MIDIKKLEKHVKLCKRNLNSKRVICCASCPFEDIIIKYYPDLKEKFYNKREELKK